LYRDFTGRMPGKSAFVTLNLIQGLSFPLPHASSASDGAPRCHLPPVSWIAQTVSDK